MIGYAVTAVITARAAEGRRVQPPDYWAEIQKIPEPRIAVIHDIDNPVIGSFWGEVNANIHKALGCVGTATDGSVRDLDEVKEAGFHFFSSCVSVSHAYVHIIDIGIPVRVGGLVVKPGDLIMGDKHGVIRIPMEIARDIPKAAQMMEDWERPVINFCKSKEFTIDGLKERNRVPLILRQVSFLADLQAEHQVQIRQPWLAATLAGKRRDEERPASFPEGVHARLLRPGSPSAPRRWYR